MNKCLVTFVQCDFSDDRDHEDDVEYLEGNNSATDLIQNREQLR